MVSHYGLQEIWLGDEYPEPSRADLVKMQAQAAEETSTEHRAPLSWDKPPRSGVLTVQEKDLDRVTAVAMRKVAKLNIFISENFYTADRVLIIVQGSGAVRPGQWARALCINQSLKAGTIFDYLDIARESNLGVIVLNPNNDEIRLRVMSEEHPNGTFHPTHKYPILGHEDHVRHIVSVYDNFVSKCAAKDLWMVAHSRGGDSALQLLNHRLTNFLIENSTLFKEEDPEQTEEEKEAEKRAKLAESKVATISASEAEEIERKRRKAESGEIDDDDHSNGKEHKTVTEEGEAPTDIQKRLRALAFTDSVHWVGGAANNDVKAWLNANAKDWVASSLPLDAPVPSNRDNAGCECVSAGHTKHEWTSPCAVNSVFEFFRSRVDNPPHFAPRQIAFSNPPQHIPVVPTTDPASTPSYADIAAGKVKLSPTETTPSHSPSASNTSPPAVATGANGTTAATPAPSATPAQTASSSGNSAANSAANTARTNPIPSKTNQDAEKKPRPADLTPTTDYTLPLFIGAIVVAIAGAAWFLRRKRA